MKKLIIILAIMLAILLAVVFGSMLFPFDEERLIEVGSTRTQEMLAVEYAPTIQSLAGSISDDIDEDTLAEFVQGTTSTLGEHQSQYTAYGYKAGRYFVCTVIEEYENGGLEISITFNHSDEIVGIYIADYDFDSEEE